MAAFRFVLLVPGAAFVADIDCPCGEAAAFLVPNARRQLGLVDPVGSPLMINETARPKFGQVCGLWAATADRWYIGVEREDVRVLRAQ
jgi:hypothetical protein